VAFVFKIIERLSIFWARIESPEKLEELFVKQKEKVAA